ncbi:hypothetical protein SD10_10015 [Spirosoma radiotolerans]|uniref:Uncharacterized protein n=2 Tax=Spirosoma radiotolerans TaxID=1379870 RepID=A0A0E3ZVQ5_9BACT|nr:hypothetical protein SD10_10015 [Spirosoma radiotolerans]
MTSQPYHTKAGSGPKGGIEQVMLKGKNFVGLRLTDTYLMVYLGPVRDTTAWYSQQSMPILKGKGCLKVTKPKKMGLAPVLALVTEGAATWK